ncbi:hypothetical protein ACCS87_21175, partial [Rhizobium ruizarguesonis]
HPLPANHTGQLNQKTNERGRFLEASSWLHHRRRHRFCVGGLRLFRDGADTFRAPLLGLYVLIIRRHCQSPFQEEVTAVDMGPTMAWRITDA